MTDDNERAAEIINRALDLVENRSEAEIESSNLDPNRADAVEHWNSLRPKAQPQPRPPRLDTQALRDASQARWDQWFDARLDAALRSYDLVVGQDIGQNCERVNREVRRLEKALDASRAEIKRLKAATRSKASEQGRVIGWKLDRPKYRAIPFYADGPGFPINLRPLFEQFFEETGIGSKDN